MVFPKIGGPRAPPVPPMCTAMNIFKKIAYFLKNCHILSRNSPFLGKKKLQNIWSGYHIQKWHRYPDAITRPSILYIHLKNYTQAQPNTEPVNFKWINYILVLVLLCGTPEIKFKKARKANVFRTSNMIELIQIEFFEVLF